MTILLNEVKKSDSLFLFELLKERNPTINISHRVMPSLEEHTKFVENYPYTKWYIAYSDSRSIGSIYISKQDEIGIFIKKEFQKLGLGTKMIQELIKKHPRKRYLANINPENKSSIIFFENQGFKLIQFTFELESK